MSKFEAEIACTVRFNAKDYDAAKEKLDKLTGLLVDKSLAIQVATVIEGTLIEVKDK